MNFYNLDNLKLFIENDRSTKDISPIRFINVETMDNWIKLKSFLTQICSEFIRISEFCSHEDTMPNINQLKSKIKNASNNTLVIPLSEHLRVSNKSALKTIDDIMKLNFTNDTEHKLKIYIPIYRMKEVLRTIPPDERNKKSILFLNTESDCDYSLTIIQNDLKAPLRGNQIWGYQKYLIYWEQNPDKPIILHTQNAIYYQDVIFSDDVRVIINAFGLLRYYYGIEETTKEEWGNEEKWKELLSSYSVHKKLDDVFCDVLFSPKFDVKLFENWEQRIDFEKWLVWLWAKRSITSGYLKLVLLKCVNYNELGNCVYDSIIDVVEDNNYFELYRERKHLVQIMKILPTTSFWSALDRMKLQTKLKCLIDNSQKEKSEILAILGQLPMNSDINEILSLVYPEVASYLSPIEIANKDIEKYFEEYRKQKIRNICTDEFKELVESLAADQGEAIWSLKSRNEIVNTEYDCDSIILYVDALGVEYLSILKKMFEDAGVDFKSNIGYCNIPSTTENNNDFYANKIFETNYDLDKLKHGISDYPNNIIKEFEILKQIFKRAIELLGEYRKIIIASDHGASRLAVLGKGEAYDIKEGAITYKYGRYCIDSINNYEEYSGCIKEGDYWIFANYDRFCGKGAPLGETHGGATLEEVIVPIICIELKKPVGTQKHKKVNIRVLTPEIKLPISKRIKVVFEVDDKLEKLTAVVKNKRYLCILTDGKYSFEPDVGKENNYTANIVEKEIIGSIEYKVIRPISSNFDI